jgi:hypothetical protein
LNIYFGDEAEGNGELVGLVEGALEARRCFGRAGREAGEFAWAHSEGEDDRRDLECYCLRVVDRGRLYEPLSRMRCLLWRAGG